LASEMLEAQKARCIESRKNPATRIIYLVYPLVLHAFRRVDDIAYAMESRCYSGEHTPATFKAIPIDWLLLALSGLVCIPVFW
jgi:energy-coupling factor transporter transmembrane protein EcfT